MDISKTTFFVLCGVVTATFAIGSFLIQSKGKEKFGFSFFSKEAWMYGFAATLCFWVGHFWIWLAEKYHGQHTEIYAWGVIAFGVAIFGFMLYQNILNTNVRYGLCASAIQIPVLMLLGTVVLPLLIFMALPTMDESEDERKQRIDRENNYWMAAGINRLDMLRNSETHRKHD